MNAEFVTPAESLRKQAEKVENWARAKERHASELESEAAQYRSQATQLYAEAHIYLMAAVDLEGVARERAKPFSFAAVATVERAA